MSEFSPGGINPTERWGLRRIWEEIGRRVGEGLGKRQTKEKPTPEEEIRRRVALEHVPFVHQQLGGDEWERHGLDEAIEVTPKMMTWLVEEGARDKYYSMDKGAEATEENLKNTERLKVEERIKQKKIVTGKEVAIRAARDLYFGAAASGLAYRGPGPAEDEYYRGMKKGRVVETIETALGENTPEGELFKVVQECHETYFGWVKEIQYMGGDLRDAMDKGWHFSNWRYQRLWVEAVAEEGAEAEFMLEVAKVEREAKLSFREAMAQVRRNARVAVPRYTWFAPEKNRYDQALQYRLLEDRFINIFERRRGIKLVWDAEAGIGVKQANRWIGAAKEYDGMTLSEVRDVAREDLRTKDKRRWLRGQRLEREAEKIVEGVRQVREAAIRAIEFKGGLVDGSELTVDGIRLYGENARGEREWKKYECKRDKEYIIEMSDWTRQLVAMVRAMATIPRVYRKGLGKAILPRENGRGLTVMFDVDVRGPWSNDVPWVKRGIEADGTNDLRELSLGAWEEEAGELKREMFYFLKHEAEDQGMTLEAYLERKGEWRFEEEVLSRALQQAVKAGVSLEGKTAREVVKGVDLEAIRQQVVGEIDNMAVDVAVMDRALRQLRALGMKVEEKNLDEVLGKIDLAGIRAQVLREVEQHREWFWKRELKSLGPIEKEGTRSRRARFNKYGIDIVAAPTWLEAIRKTGVVGLEEMAENQYRKAMGARSENMYQLRLMINSAWRVFSVGEGNDRVLDEEFGFPLNFVRRQPEKMEAYLMHDVIFPRQPNNQYNEKFFGFLESGPGAYRLEALLEADYTAGKVPYAAQRAEEVSIHSGSVGEMVNRFTEFIKRRWLLTKEIIHPLLAKILQRAAEGTNELNRLAKTERLEGEVGMNWLRQCGMKIPGWDQIRDAKPWQKAIFWRGYLNRDYRYFLLKDYGNLAQRVRFRNWSRDDFGDMHYVVETAHLSDEERQMLQIWQRNVDAIRSGDDPRKQEVVGMTEVQRKKFLDFETKVKLDAVDRAQRAEARDLLEDVARGLARDNRVKSRLRLSDDEVELLDPRLRSDTSPELSGEKINYKVVVMHWLRRITETADFGRIEIQDEGEWRLLDEEERAVLNPTVEKVEGLTFIERERERERLMAVLVDDSKTRSAVAYNQTTGVWEYKNGLWVITLEGEDRVRLAAGREEVESELRPMNSGEVTMLKVWRREELQQQMGDVRRIGDDIVKNTRAGRYEQTMGLDKVREMLRGEEIRMPLPKKIDRGDPLYGDYRYYELLFESPRGGAAMYHKFMPFIGLENPSDVMAVMDWAIKNKCKVYGVKFKNGGVVWPMEGFGDDAWLQYRLQHYVGVGRGRGGKFHVIDREKRKLAEEELKKVKERLIREGFNEPIDDVVIPNSAGMLPVFVYQIGDEWNAEEGAYVSTFNNRLIVDAGEDNAFYGSVGMHIAFGDMSYDVEWQRSKRFDMPDTLAAVYDYFTYLITQTFMFNKRRIAIRFWDYDDEQVAAITPGKDEIGIGPGRVGMPTVLETVIARFLRLDGFDLSFGLLEKMSKLFRNLGPRVGPPMTSYFEYLSRYGGDKQELVAAQHLIGSTSEEGRGERAEKYWEGVEEKTAKGLGTQQAAGTTVEAIKEGLAEVPGGSLLVKPLNWAARMVYGQTVRSGFIVGGLGAAGAVPLAINLLGAGQGVVSVLGGYLPVWMRVLGAGGVVGGALVVGFGMGVLAWHIPRVITGHYQSDFSRGFPLQRKKPIGDSYLDLAENAKATYEGRAKRGF